MTNKILNHNPYPTLSVPFTPVSLIFEIIFLILKLILSGKTETDAIKIISVKQNLPENTVREIWKTRK